MEIRLATPADHPALAEIFRRASLSNAGDRAALLAHPESLELGSAGVAEGRTFAAELDGVVVGFATWAEAAGDTELADLFVDPDRRRHGAAAALVDRVVDELAGRGVAHLYVTANPHALGFYRAAGFVACGDVTTPFGPAPRMVRAVGDGAAHEAAPLDAGPFFHGTIADLAIGEFLTAGHRSNYRPEVVMNHVYFTALVDGAGLAAEIAAELAEGDPAPRVYAVEPTGAFENDPNVTDKKFPGNPTRSYRSSAPLRVTSEITDWTRLTAEQRQTWRDRLAVLLSGERGEIIN